MKFFTSIIIFLFLSFQLNAHCGGCGPASSTSHSSSYSNSLEKSECTSCSKSSENLKLSRKERQACNKVMDQYEAELELLKAKYIEKLDSILSEDELALYVEQQGLN